MTLTKGRIDRTGKVCFGDASISICEEGIADARKRGGYEGAKNWEIQFKRDVFLRIAQMLRRIGWKCEMPAINPHDVKHYGGNVARWSAERHRICSKGDLKGELDVSGRCIKFEMWQGVNTPTRPDHGGRYESNKEGCMPYVLRLEMERTRRRICDYLCNVFTGYQFDPKHYSIYRKPLEMTAIEKIQQHYAESWHFKGDLTTYQISDYNRKSADGAMLDHGQRVWFFDRKGRISTGIAQYNINNMWWVVTGKYDYKNEASFELYAKCPENPRVKRNASQRRKRLEVELQKAIAEMNFERAAVLRDILFPGNPELFVVWHEDHKAYHAPGFCGYRADQSQAGKFTAEEVRNWDHAPNKIIAISKHKEAA